MIYIENIFVCVAAPLLIAALCTEKKYLRFFLFCFAGMAACLLSAYINTFFAGLYSADALIASAEIAPVVEEVMKLLPVLFYLLVFEPKKEQISLSVLIVAASFATFENICYLIGNGAENLSFLLIRGFGTGAMHIVCGILVGYGLSFAWKRPGLKLAGSFGLLGMSVTYHGVYNLLAVYGGKAQYIAYVFPVFTGIVFLFIKRINEAKRSKTK